MEVAPSSTVAHVRVAPPTRSPQTRRIRLVFVHCLHLSAEQLPHLFGELQAARHHVAGDVRVVVATRRWGGAAVPECRPGPCGWTPTRQPSS
jgi:hypothetical protein